MPHISRLNLLFAKNLFRIAAILAPGDRRVWINAMAAEWEFLPHHQRSTFAAGCMFTAINLRISDMITRKDIFFFPAVIGAILMALLCGINGIGLFSKAPMVAGTLLTTSFIWGAVAGAFLFRTRSRVAHMALGGLAYYLAIGIIALASSVLPPSFADNSTFFAAFALEGIGLTLALLAIAWFNPLWSDQSRPIDR